METVLRSIDRPSVFDVAGSLATIIRLVRVADSQSGVPPETRHCLDQVAAEVRELARACHQLIERAGDPPAAPPASTGYDPARLRAGLIGDPAALVAEFDRPATAVDALAPLVDPASGRGTGLATLTRQEQRILKLLADGCTNRQIAAELFLAEKTVKNYVSNLLRKLGMERRTQAAVYATRLALAPGRPSRTVPHGRTAGSRA